MPWRRPQGRWRCRLTRRPWMPSWRPPRRREPRGPRGVVSLAARPPQPGDLPAVVELGRAFDEALTGEGDWTETDLADDWRSLADLQRDAWVVERDGVIAGYA